MLSRTPDFPWPKALQAFKTLRGKFIIGFIIASVLAVTNILIVQSLLRQSDTTAATVNIAGKMRMLSQRIGLLQLARHGLGVNDEHALADYLKKLDSDLQKVLKVLRNGGDAFGLTISPVAAELHEHLNSIETSWSVYRGALINIRLNSSENRETASERAHNADLINKVILSSDRLLTDTESFIDSLVEREESLQKKGMYEIYGLFLVNILMLLLAWAIVSSKVLRPIQHVMRLSNELAAGNFSYRLRMNSDDEFGSLSKVLNGSAAHIEQLLGNIEIQKSNLEHAESKLRRAALVYQNISDGVIITDANGYVQDVNPAFSGITGYDPEEIIGHRMSKISSGRHTAEFFRSLWQELEITGHWKGDIWNKNKAGQIFVSHLMISSCFNDDGSVNCRIGLFSDVTERRKREAEIWRQANFDHLTQLPNRQMFHEKLQESIEQSRRSGVPFALIFLDLDLFKEVNDTFGHDEGDMLLRQVAHRISTCCRRSDQVARLGGDEFVLIIKDLKDPESVHSICNTLLESIAKPYSLSVSGVRISCSAGVAFYPNDACDATELLKMADLAMYAAKEKGRNQYCLFSRNMRDSVQLRHDLLRDLHLAVDAGQFVLHYQPIIDMASGKVAKAEVLARWAHPELGLVSPGDFIPLAEDSGLIVPIGESVFRQAAQQVSQWRRQLSPDLSVSVNVSPAQFQIDGLNAKSWAYALLEFGLPGSAITIEITEGLLMEDQEYAYEKLREFRRAGFRIALDDFGTGYSSISYLRRVDIDIIKIDQSFVRNLAENSENMALCNAIITMSHQLGLKVIAEGIESEEQHRLLHAAGCDYGQGYFYSKPVSAEQFAQWLSEREGGSDAGINPSSDSCHSGKLLCLEEE